MTFLAFANGAPDVISALSASGSSQDGIFMAVGALTGAGVFVSGFVSAVVVLSAAKVGKKVELDYRTFVRDCIFYILACGILISAALVGEISLTIGFAYLGLYVL